MVDLFGNACKLFQKMSNTCVVYFIYDNDGNNIKHGGCKGGSFIYYINVHNNFHLLYLLVLVKPQEETPTNISIHNGCLFFRYILHKIIIKITEQKNMFTTLYKFLFSIQT